MKFVVAVAVGMRRVPALLGVHRLRPRLGYAREPADIAHHEAGQIVREEGVEERVRAFEVWQALDLEWHLFDRALSVHHRTARARFGRQAVDFDRDIHRKCR